MTAWVRQKISQGRVEQTRLGWHFAVALAFVLLVLICVGSFLRFIW
jgi:NADH:ubiquinone oxidoreductase subunit H